MEFHQYCPVGEGHKSQLKPGLFSFFLFFFWLGEDAVPLQPKGPSLWQEGGSPYSALLPGQAEAELSRKSN